MNIFICSTPHSYHMVPANFPAGNYIDEIHKHWWGKYEELEWNHSYIQW